MGEASPSSWSSAAAAAYDYERDPRWRAYRASLSVPPHLFSHPYVGAYLQHKFYRRFVVLIVALIGILPLAPQSLQYKGYRLSLLGTTCTTGYALFAFYRLPRAGNLQTVQAWCHHVTSSKDFIPFMYCLMFVTSKLRLKLVLLPVICWALEHVARFLRRYFANSSLYRTYLEQPCTWVEMNVTALHFLCSNAEILLGFLLIFSLFTRQRNAMQTFMYWQLLKLMYHSPFTAAYHRAIWLKIGRTINPYIHRYTPLLHDPINAGMRWWFR